MPPLAQMIVMQRYAGVDNNAADNSARQALGTVCTVLYSTLDYIVTLPAQKKGL